MFVQRLRKRKRVVKFVFHLLQPSEQRTAVAAVEVHWRHACNTIDCNGVRRRVPVLRLWLEGYRAPPSCHNRFFGVQHELFCRPAPPDTPRRITTCALSTWALPWKLRDLIRHDVQEDCYENFVIRFFSQFFFLFTCFLSSVDDRPMYVDTRVHDPRG